MSRIARSLAASALIALACIPLQADGQSRSRDYPSRPIRVVIGIAPGGGLDTMTRLAAQKLTELFGQTVVVDNRPGGGTVLGMDIVAHAQPDGYTLLCASETLILNGVLRRAKYDVREAFVPIGRITAQQYLLAAHPGLPASTLKELIALARSQPGQLSYGSPGVGTTLHVGWERLSAMAELSLLHVPYKGGALAILDVMNGQIQMLMTTVPTVAPHARAGRVKLLATTGPRRVPVFAEVPTMAESGLPGYELTNSYAFYAPAGTPAAIVEKVNAALTKGMRSPDTVRIVAADGGEVAAGPSPEAFRARFLRDYAEMENTTRVANIRLN
jgi:tripartite-type tricarboxylate transporter receptor subunit TctC